jgi:hypothetical protein
VVSSIISLPASFLSFSADVATLSQLSDESRLARSDFPEAFSAPQLTHQDKDWRTDEVALVPTAAVHE